MKIDYSAAVGSNITFQPMKTRFRSLVSPRSCVAPAQLRVRITIRSHGRESRISNHALRNRLTSCAHSPIQLGSLLLALFIALGPAVQAAVSLTITPSIITNDFSGKIVLNIAGLTSGATVRVDKFFDLNSNGAVDASDQLVQSFGLTDGQLPLIGNVRNANVAGDDDSAADGQMRAEIFLPGVDLVVDRTVASFIYRISDPAGGFSTIAQPFAVKPRIYSQGVTGRVTAAATGLPVTNAFVLLLVPDRGPSQTTFTDANGNYTIYSVPGSYAVGALRNGFVANFGAPPVTLVPNQLVTNNVSLASATLAVSGRVTDNSTGAGVAGLLVTAESETGLFAFGFTDPSGTYSFLVTAGQWKIKLEETQPAQLGYVSPNNLKT